MQTATPIKILSVTRSAVSLEEALIAPMVPTAATLFDEPLITNISNSTERTIVHILATKSVTAINQVFSSNAVPVFPTVQASKSIDHKTGITFSDGFEYFVLQKVLQN